MFIQVVPGDIDTHVAKINTTVGQIEQYQQTIRTAISDPSLRSKGQYWSNALDAAQSVLASLDTLKLQQSQLGAQISAVSMATQETDGAMARSVQV